MLKQEHSGCSSIQKNTLQHENDSKSQQQHPIEYKLAAKAERILEAVLNRYGNNVDVIFGRSLSREEITQQYNEWADRNNLLKNELTVKNKRSALSCLPELHFSNEIICSAKLVTNGPQRKVNRPENRSYKLIVRSNEASSDNLFIREHSFGGLLDHELGTHFFRMLNEGLQPWYYDRKKFNLCAGRGRDILEAEEGLAALHTVLKMPMQELWFPALLYITGIYYQRSNDLFGTVQKLQRYCSNKEFCLRIVKRAVQNKSSHDQAYLIGAVKLLENRKTIDFKALMCGRLTGDELQRVKRITRKFGVRTPDFMDNMRDYNKRLDEIAEANFID